MRQNLIIFISLMMFFGVTACVANDQPNPSTEQLSMQAVNTADQARAIAEKYIAERNLNWGKSSSVIERSRLGNYWVTFETPSSEVRLLGQRVIVVDIKSGEAKPLPRR